jgi:hypothetical protein
VTPILQPVARKWCWAALSLLLLLAVPVLAAGEEGSETEVWLLTYGPGEIYWQRFGHNAIWIRDQGLGLDHAFNFGFFDFAQEDFFLRFLRGRMLYFSAAQPAREEFAGYIDENRGIRAQKLDLEPDQKLWLLEFLLADIRPENRDYLYDYYTNNCATRVRDALDEALGGALRAASSEQQADQSWRDHTRRLTYRDFWLYLGLETGLGAPVDKAISRWDEMFIPATLADAVAGLQLTGGSGSRPLVLEDAVLYRSTLDPPPAVPSGWWPRYLLVSLLIVLASALILRKARPAWRRGLARAWLMLAGIAGLALVFFWFQTDHSVARMNLNVLVLNPLWLMLALRPGKGKRAFALVAAFSLLSLVLPWIPPHQYNFDVLAAFLPLNLAAAWVLRAAAGPVSEAPA